MTVLDAYAVLALLKGEPAAVQVQRILDEDASASLTALGVAEVVDHLVRLVGADEESAALDLAQLGLSTPGDLGPDLAMRAGILRARHYHRRNRAVSLADCVLAETARTARAPVASSDPHLLDMCQAEGLGVFGLPDSRGKTWSAAKS